MEIDIDTAKGYLAAGLCALPAIRGQKRPAVGYWTEFRARLPTECEVRSWFANHHDGICVVAGRVSGNLECLDFDNGGECFAAWMDQVDPELFARLAVERTPSGGYHVLYRCEAEVDGNLKLARGEREAKQKTLIETRGEGGVFLCAPSEGYELRQGDLAHLPVLSSAEREALLAAARAFDEVKADESPELPPLAHVGADSGPAGGFELRPGDDFSERGDIRPILEAHGWQPIGRKPDGNELWRRPGKDQGTHSATYDGKVFYVFSSNAAPFDSGKGYSGFQVYAILECGGDHTRAARELLGKGYGKALAAADVDFSGLDSSVDGAGKAAGAQRQAAEPARQAPPFMPLPLGELVEKYPKMRPVLIHGFLRIGETMNIIAPPKTGKSWLVTDLALSVATGRQWFGYPCERGKVLIIDNELHPETSANRIPKVVEARGVDIRKVRNEIYVDNQRGRLSNIDELSKYIGALKPMGFRLIIIDAFYRALPRGTDENDNGTVAGIYNTIDKYAAALDCAFILIHHTSKGNQSLKSVTDVGAGAGSQSRASDAHVILRRHKEPGVVVMESVVRSFPSVQPICLRWNWPLWDRDDSLNPEDLEGKRDEPRGANEPDPSVIAGRLAELVDNERPMSKGVFTETVRTHYNVMEKTARMAVELAITSGLIQCGRIANQPRGSQATKFVTKPDAAGEGRGDEEDDDSSDD